jgi:geranylgeranyl pyrophosphate synthase
MNDPSASKAPWAEAIASLDHVLAELFGPDGAAAEVPPATWQSGLVDPLRDILMRSGKGFRGRFVAQAWRLGGGAPRPAPEMLSCAVELLHAGSLVIDDIQDDSHLRRGELALHRRYGLPIALNTGNCLYFLALALLARVPLPANRRAVLYEDLHLALLRCHQGQALDLSVKITERRRREVMPLVECTTRLKTGSLMRLAALLGARAAGGPEDAVRALGRFGEEFGVGLQMLDDWSGIALERRRSKGVEDLRLGRPIWPWAWLVETGDELAYAEAAGLARRASIDWEADQVRERMRALLSTLAPSRIRIQLNRALADLEAALGASDDLSALRAEVDLLERAFLDP